MSKARIEQALEGVHLLMDEPIRCADCGVRLSDGTPITIAAVRDGEVWRVRHVWGAACAPHSFDEFGAADALAEADLGSAVDTAAQQHYPIPLSVVVVDVRETPDGPESKIVTDGGETLTTLEGTKVGVPVRQYSSKTVLAGSGCGWSDGRRNCQNSIRDGNVGVFRCVRYESGWFVRESRCLRHAPDELREDSSEIPRVLIRAGVRAVGKGALDMSRSSRDRDDDRDVRHLEIAKTEEVLDSQNVEMETPA